VPTAPAAAGRPTITSDRIQLVGDGGRTLQVGVRTELGKHLARQFGPDAEFWDARQCVLERLPDGRWQVAPIAGAINETLVNGEAARRARRCATATCSRGARRPKGIAKLPLTVRAL
jgi:hypothetical protein